LPSDKILSQKQAFVAELAEALQDATSAVLVDYKGITVADDTRLRRELREADVEYRVVKNTLLKLAAEKAGYAELSEVLTGSTAIAYSADAVAPAKVLNKFAEGSKGKFTIKAGFVEGRTIDTEGVVALAKLPNRDQLVAMALGGLNAPITSFVSVLNANIRGLAVALNAIAEQKSA
jgi:large subunit ribosomal protein L10